MNWQLKYIFVNINIHLDVGQLHGGMNLGKNKEIVDSYADANELYDTFMEEQWRKQLLMSDHETNSRIIESCWWRILTSFPIKRYI